ncbi:MAG: hypothetical protein CMM95_00770, partial [Rickettsiales bacterium]|nr:hypothetical protein [Rickettsiales bacterium]
MKNYSRLCFFLLFFFFSIKVGAKNYDDEIMVTSTGTGEVAVFSIGQEKRYSFSKLDGKPDFLKDMEWVQNTVKYGKTMIGLDSNRTS